MSPHVNSFSSVASAAIVMGPDIEGARTISIKGVIRVTKSILRTSLVFSTSCRRATRDLMSGFAVLALEELRPLVVDDRDIEETLDGLAAVGLMFRSDIDVTAGLDDPAFSFCRKWNV